MNGQEMKDTGATLVTDNSPQPEETPTRSEETPTRSEETPAQSEETPTRSEETPTRSEETPTRSEETPTQSEETPAQSEGTTTQPSGTPAQPTGTPVPTTQDITQITEGLKQIVVALKQVADNLEKTTRKSEQIDVLKKKRKNLWWKKFWTIIGVIICVFVLGGLQFILLQKFGKVTDNNNSLTIWSWIVVAVTVVMQLLIVCIQISKFNKYSQIINKLDLLIMKVCLVPTSSSIEIERELQLITRLWDNKKSILDVFIKN